MFVNWRGTVVVCAYFVPQASPFAKYNEKRMIELQERILECSSDVMLLTDSNAWIGELPSEVSKTEDGYERETRTFTRTSEKKETNKQGEEFLVAMNSIDMIVLNGVKSNAKYTYDHPGREARSVVDYIAVRENMFERVSEIKYVDSREKLQNDHITISVSVQHNAPKEKERTKVNAMEKLKKITRKDPFWKSLETECNENFDQFVTAAGHTVDEEYHKFKVSP